MSAVTPGTAPAGAGGIRDAVTVREISEVADLSAAATLLDRIWSMPEGESVVSTGVLRAWAFTGNYVAAAYADDEIVGVSTGFLGVSTDGEGRMLHSHVTGVSPLLRGRSVGSLMKRHQREWAAARGIDEITWTFDPAIRRNAHFNLVKLGAAPVAYLPDFYGRLDDGINAGGPSDRLLVSWRIDATEAAAPASPVDPSGALPLLANEEGRPVLHAPDATAPRRLVALPEDIEALRSADPALALQWRLALREAMTEHPGYRLAGLTADDRYLLVRDDRVRHD